MSAARKRGSPSAADNQDLRRTGDKIDAGLAGQQFLRGRHIDVARADDAIGFRHRRRAERESRDGLRAAHLKHLRHLQQMRRAEDLIHRAWDTRADIRTPATCAGTTVMMSVEGSG